MIEGVCSSRLARDARGRTVVIATSVGLGVDVGARWIVIGNSFWCARPGVTWLGKTGRAPSPEERSQARCPFDPVGIKAFKRAPEPEVPDELLDEQAAIEARVRRAT